MILGVEDKSDCCVKLNDKMDFHCFTVHFSIQ